MPSLKNGANVDWQLSDGMVPLHIAAKKGNLLILKKLLEKNALANLKTAEKGYTPLMLACDNLNIECAKCLMENGADLQIQDNEDKTVLYHAVFKKSLPLVEIILRYKPDKLNTCNKDSLRMAVETDSDIAKSLREYGIIFNSDVINNPEILLHAIQNGNITLVKDLLLLNINLNELTFYKQIGTIRPLHYAAKLGNEEICKLLINYGCKVNRLRPGPRRRSAKMLPINDAIDNRHFNIFKLLLARGSSLNVQALHTAVFQDNIEIIDNLMKYGANINAADGGGVTPLHICARAGSKNTCRVLLEYGANFNLQVGQDSLNRDFPSESTALHIASRFANKQVLEMLLESHGHEIAINSCLNALNANDQTPVTYSIRNNSSDTFMLFLSIDPSIIYTPGILSFCVTYNRRKKFVEFLIRLGADVDGRDGFGITALHITVINKSDELFQLLLHYRADIDLADADGTSALHWAANRCATLCVSHLVGEVSVPYGDIFERVCVRNINARDHSGRTALHFNAHTSNSNICSLLLKHDVDVNARDDEGSTALHMACSSRKNKIAKVLLRVDGVDINCRDILGKTALNCAASINNPDSVKSLLKNGADLYIVDNDRFSPLDNALRRLEREQSIDRLCPGQEIVTRLSFEMEKLNNAVSHSQIITPASLNLLNTTEDEVLNMKSIKMYKTYFMSYYDFMTRDNSFIIAFLRNENLVKVLESDDFKKKFPYHSFLIKETFQKCYKRRQLLDKANDFITDIFQCVRPELQFGCIENILGFFSNKELKVFLSKIVS